MGSYYIYIYLIVLGTILLRQSIYPLVISPFKYGYQGTKEFVSWTIMIVCTLFIGLRPLSDAFGDMAVYSANYDFFRGQPFHLNLDTTNIIYDQLIPFFASYGLPPEFFYTFIAVIYFGCMLIACRKLFPCNLLVAYLACLTAFSTFSYSVNGIKAGVAASIFLVALAYHDKRWLSILLALVSWGFHHSMSMVLVSYVLSYFFKSTKLYFYLWVVALILAIAHVGYFQTLFAGWVDEQGARYLIEDENSYLTGFRPDFILYSAIPIALGYWLIFKKGIKDTNYELWLRMYLSTNSLWMLCMYASFSNRIAYLSWFMFPIVLIHPFFSLEWSDRQTFYARKVIMWHYAFTLFMEVVYNNFIK